MTKTDIIKVMNTIKDNPRNIEKSTDLLYQIQSSRGPLLEVVTLIKYENPQLYFILKKRFADKPLFKFMFEVSIEYDLAKKSLGI